MHFIKRSWHLARPRVLANSLAKHPKSGREVRAALPSIGMFESSEEEIERFTKINVEANNGVQLTLEKAGSTSKDMPHRGADSSPDLEMDLGVSFQDILSTVLGIGSGATRGQRRSADSKKFSDNRPQPQ